SQARLRLKLRVESFLGSQRKIFLIVVMQLKLWHKELRSRWLFLAPQQEVNLFIHATMSELVLTAGSWWQEILDATRLYQPTECRARKRRLRGVCATRI